MSNTTQQPRRYDLGGCTVTLLDGGRLWLDGGAMFGIIPKPLWSRETPADERNRIELACNCLLVEWQRETARRVIVETGHGAKYHDKEQAIFGIDPGRWLLPALRAADADPESISDVVLTHLHFDHAGGLTHERDGRVEPAFPNATVHVQWQEFQDAVACFGIMTATYRKENYDPISDAGRWDLLDGEAEILPGVRPLLTPGHTRGHQSIIVEGSDRALVYTGDVMPTRAHAGAAYNMGYDLFPIDNRDSKRRLLQTAVERDWLLALDHEPRTPVVRAAVDGEWFVLTDAG